MALSDTGSIVGARVVSPNGDEGTVVARLSSDQGPLVLIHHDNAPSTLAFEGSVRDDFDYADVNEPSESIGPDPSVPAATVNPTVNPENGPAVPASPGTGASS